MLSKKYAIAIACFLLCNCTRDKTPLGPTNGDAFGIYFLQNSSLKIKDVLQTNLEDLQLEEQAFISGYDVDYYDFSSHCIYLKQAKSKFFPNWSYYYMFPPDWTDKPFVVVADHQPCYLGSFATQSSVYMWPAVEVDSYDVGRYPKDILHFDWLWGLSADIRDNELLKKSLETSKLLHEGIEVSIDTTDAIIFINNDDTSTIKYSFTITNRDKDILYVLDSEKVGVDIFHYYNNGPVFYHKESNEIYESRYKKPSPVPANRIWDLSWYTKIESHHSIKREVELRGYPRFDAGTYYFFLRYNAPIKHLEKQNRNLSDGRIWIGPTISNILALAITQDTSSTIVITKPDDIVAKEKFRHKPQASHQHVRCNPNERR